MITRCIAWIVTCLVSLCGAAIAQAHPTAVDERLDMSFRVPMRVLVIYANERTLLANQGIQQGFWSSLRELIKSDQVELNEEYLDIHELGDPGAQERIAGYLKLRYHGMTPDVVIIVGPRSIGVLREMLSSVFPGVPFLFAGLWEGQLTAEEVSLWSGGVFYELSVSVFLDLARRLLPENQQVVLVGGSASIDQLLLHHFREEIAARVPWDIRVLSQRSPEAIGKALSQLDSNTAVLWTTYFRDEKGQSCVPREVLEQISVESSAPIFGFFDSLSGAGAVAIIASPFEAQGRKLGALVQQFVAGEPIDTIGVHTVPALRYIIDQRAMDRFGLDVGALPPEAEILYETPSLMKEHALFVLLGSAVVLVQTSLLSSLWWTRRQQKKAEKQAVEMENYFSTVFMQSPSPKAILRVNDWVIQEINPAYEAFFSVKREEARGRTPDEVGIFAVDYEKKFLKSFLQSGSTQDGFELKVQLATGEVRYVELFSNTMEVDGVEFYLLVALDVSDRIKAEKLRSNLARDNRVAQLGQISVAIAHEINQPLGSILSNAEAALMHLEKMDAPNEELWEILSEIKTEDRRAARIVERIRAMLGGNSETKVPVAMHEIIAEAVEMVRGEARRRGVRVRMLTAEKPVGVVLGERVLLVQVLLNLLFNALDAVDSLPTARRVVTIDCPVSSISGALCLSVSDRGPGILPAQIEQLFDFYYSTKKKGMGLGLAISKHIIEDHKGRISVNNIEEGGACFYIHLPLRSNDS